MSDLGRLERFLWTDPRDVGCAEAMAVLHVYVDLVAAGQDPAGRYPGLAAHLAACGPCDEDFTRLLVAATGDLATGQPGTKPRRKGAVRPAEPAVGAVSPTVDDPA